MRDLILSKIRDDIIELCEDNDAMKEAVHRYFEELGDEE